LKLPVITGFFTKEDIKLLDKANVKERKHAKTVNKLSKCLTMECGFTTFYKTERCIYCRGETKILEPKV